MLRRVLDRIYATALGGACLAMIAIAVWCSCKSWAASWTAR